jgi:hypothetical protein
VSGPAADGEQGVTASFGFFALHRIAPVTDKQLYVFRSRPFHQPGKVARPRRMGAGAMLEGGCATLTGSDSDGNQRARPSSECPLSAKAA